MGIHLLRNAHDSEMIEIAEKQKKGACFVYGIVHVDGISDAICGDLGNKWPDVSDVEIAIVSLAQWNEMADGAEVDDERIRELESTVECLEAENQRLLDQVEAFEKN